MVLKVEKTNLTEMIFKLIVFISFHLLFSHFEYFNAYFEMFIADV